MSDLELVAEATRNEREAQPTSQSIQNSAAKTDNAPASGSASRNHESSTMTTSSHLLEEPDDTAEKEDHLDLASLTPDDRAMLQPLIDTLRISDPSRLPTNSVSQNGITHTEGHPGRKEGEEEPEDDEIQIAQILAQMDAADHVADDLEGKLDQLLANLGRVEAELGAQEEKKG